MTVEELQSIMDQKDIKIVKNKNTANSLILTQEWKIIGEIYKLPNSDEWFLHAHTLEHKIHALLDEIKKCLNGEL